MRAVGSFHKSKRTLSVTSKTTVVDRSDCTMFRESNEPERHLHPSYRNKAVSGFQQVAMSSKLDDSAYREHITNTDVFSKAQPVPVPATYDTVYDPTHPDADWSGMVSLRFQHKKHSHDHSSQKMGITQCEHGIVAKVERQEWGHRKQPEGASKNASQLVISGVGGDSGADRFKTEYRRFAEHEGTQRDQLTLEKRMKSVKQIQDPAQARPLRDRMPGQQELGSPYTVGSGMGQESPRGQQYDGGSAYGGASTYSTGPSARIAPASLYGKKSFISDIAGSIAAKVELPPARGSSTDAAFSHNRTLVTDNYKPFPGTRQLSR
jgi:hypothetical protein